MTDSSECQVCKLNADPAGAPGGPILQTEHWRLEHIIQPIPMLGWLVLKPLRHIEQFDMLTEDEAAEYGPFVRGITAALRAELQPAKIYVALFAEAEGFTHLHVHIIPRFEDTPDEMRGPRIFGYLGRAISEQQDLADRDEAMRLATSLRDRLSA